MLFVCAVCSFMSGCVCGCVCVHDHSKAGVSNSFLVKGPHTAHFDLKWARPEPFNQHSPLLLYRLRHWLHTLEGRVEGVVTRTACHSLSLSLTHTLHILHLPCLNSLSLIDGLVFSFPFKAGSFATFVLYFIMSVNIIDTFPVI